MLRIASQPRSNWQQLATEFGFHFHTMYGEPYWDESAYYQFSLQQIEQDIEDPTEELHQMCLHVVDKVVQSEALLRQCQIPESHWDYIANSWQQRQPSLYSRLDLVYDGNGPAKLLENNADTPTSLYETGFWQWLWLENLVDQGKIARSADQFNSLQEKLINRFADLKQQYQYQRIHFTCCADSTEDRGTVQYLQDCASAAGIDAPFLYVEEIGLGDTGYFTDVEDNAITHCFKLYPWEFMLREEFGDALAGSDARWLEPAWKSIISNKALLPLLWQSFENHPNLLPAFFEQDAHRAGSGKWIKKPLFSREGANISLLEDNQPRTQFSDGPYGEEGFVIQQFNPLPRYGEHYVLIGSWLVDDQAAGISLREDSSLITQDLSRYLPHIIL